MQNDNNNFVDCVLFSDEACFTRAGIFNLRNNHVWAHENPHAVHIRSYQWEFRVNVWAAVAKDQIIGPIFLPPRLNGQIYSDEIVDNLPDMIQGIGMDVGDIWFQQDGAPPHWSRAVRNQLNQMFPQRWIGRGGPTNMPPRSPDLTVMDYFVWSWIKNDVYSHQINTEDQLRTYITESFDRLRADPAMIQNASRNILRRCQLCIENNGRHIEQLL